MYTHGEKKFPLFCWTWSFEDIVILPAWGISMLGDGSDTEEAEREERLGFSWSKRNIKIKISPDL